MAEYNLSIIADADDGHETGGTTWTNRTDEGYASGEFFTVRRDDGAPETASLGALRFQNLPVAQGATITSATLTVEIAAIGGNDPTTAILTITGDDVDDAAELGENHRPSSGWTDTTAVANASELATGSLPIDVTDIVQEIVDRAGWESGNAIAFKLSATGEDTYWAANIADYDADTMAVVATLDVITAEGDPVPSISGLSDTTLTHGQTGIVITLTGASESGNTVLISPTDDVEDVDAVAQTITAESATEITFTADLDSFDFGATLYLFVINGDSESNADGEAVSRVIASATLVFSTEDSNVFIDEAGDPVTATDLTFHIWRAERPSGNPDQIITDVDITSGELSLSIDVGSLDDEDPVSWFVFDPDSQNAQLFGAGVTNVTAG